MACDSRALFAERLLRDLHDDFLPRLEQIGNELRALRLATVMWALPAITLSSTAPHGPLHSGAKIPADASLRRLRLCFISFRRGGCLVQSCFAFAQFDGFRRRFRVRLAYFTGNAGLVGFIV